MVVTKDGIDFRTLCQLPVEKVSVIYWALCPNSITEETYQEHDFSPSHVNFQGGNSFVLLGNGDIFVTGGKTEADQRLEPGVRTYIYR